MFPRVSGRFSSWGAHFRKHRPGPTSATGAWHLAPTSLQRRWGNETLVHEIMQLRLAVLVQYEQLELFTRLRHPLNTDKKRNLIIPLLFAFPKFEILYRK